MALQPMAPGGRWVRPPHDAPPVYVPAKQADSHLKRLFADGWVPIDDPRREEDMERADAHVQAEVANVSAEIAMQSRIDQLETLVAQQSALVQQLLTSQKEHADGTEKHDDGSHSENPQDDRRSVRRKSTV